MTYPNRIQAALLLNARFDDLDAVVRDFARVAEMKSGAALKIREQHPGAFYRLFGAGSDLMLTFEYIDAAPPAAHFAAALASPVTTLFAPDMRAHLESARSHILIEASHGPLSPAEPSPISAALLGGSDIAAHDASAFHQRLEALVLMARLVIDHVTPTALHWTQSNQLLEPEAFETMASGGFPGPLSIHPLLFSDEAEQADSSNGTSATVSSAPRAVGLRTFGARHWLGREIVVPPSALPWEAAYESVLSFCAFATMDDGRIIPDGDTFGPAPDESGQSGEVWRVHHRAAKPGLTRNDAFNNPSNDDADARGGPVPVYELIPLRHDACGFIAEEYAQNATVLCERAPTNGDANAQPADEVPDEALADDEPEADSALAELKAALAEGRAAAAANPPESAPPAVLAGTPSLAGEVAVSGRSLRAKVFGQRNSQA